METFRAFTLTHGAAVLVLASLIAAWVAIGRLLFIVALVAAAFAALKLLAQCIPRKAA